jgi:hypothetical protein
MFSSKALRTAGLVALCLVIGAVFSGALGGAQVQAPLPPEIITSGDPGFDSLAKQLVAATPRNRIPFVGWLPPPPPELLAKECGTTIAEIFIDPEAPKDQVAAARSLDDGPPLIGAARSLDEGSYLLSRVPLPKGVYYVWMGRERMLGRIIPIPPEPDDGFNNWFIFIGHIKTPPEMIGITAILYYKDEKFRTPEEWLNIIGSIIGLKDRGCDLTVRHLSVTAHKISPPCMVPPCLPPWWDIMALATIANIGQIDVKDPFTVRVLLNGRIIHEEEITKLAAGAQQIILASETVYSPGLYTVTVIVDPADKIKERDETNNIAEGSVNVQ